MRKLMESSNAVWTFLLFAFIGILSLEVFTFFTMFGKKKTTVSTNDSSEYNIVTIKREKEETTEPLVYDYGDEDVNFTFIGDSRTVGMQMAVGQPDTFVCENGIGYHWVMESAQMDKIIRSANLKNSVVVILIGVNDIQMGSGSYGNLIEKIQNNTNAKIYFVSVNPVDEEQTTKNGYGYTTNERIQKFNESIMALCEKYDIEYINCYDQLLATGYNTVDGLHYTNSTYKNIFYFIKNYVFLDLTNNGF